MVKTMPVLMGTQYKRHRVLPPAIDVADPEKVKEVLSQLKDDAKVKRLDPNIIGNKSKRSKVYREQKHEKKMAKKERRLQRKALREKLGEEVVPIETETIDMKRVPDVTMVEQGDEEIEGEEEMDEFASYFKDRKDPKIMITTQDKPSPRSFDFIRDLLWAFPSSAYYERKKVPIKKIVEYAKEENFTDIFVITEYQKEPRDFWIIHLPDGPTALFKIRSLKLNKEIRGHARPTLHDPEIIMSNFGTRLGHRIGRMLAVLFKHRPNFKGRRAITFHNQRDFIFFRHHRYIFDSAKKARLQEIGPRFTLKLQRLQKGTFDTTAGEFEWMPKKELRGEAAGRTTFHL
mmetsp:Transcript_12466/g.33345  ORF Transcript_12466/g.33345 Transcript_12466/m.33345 type:complete len:345 (-) Transcript_12466:93-1127(-)